mgnify:CR=1 FL=1
MEGKGTSSASLSGAKGRSVDLVEVDAEVEIIKGRRRKSVGQCSFSHAPYTTSFCFHNKVELLKLEKTCC